MVKPSSATSSRRHALLLVGSTVTLALTGCLSQSVLSGRQSCAEEHAISFGTPTDQFIVTTDDNTVESLVFTLENHAECPLTVAPGSWVIEHNTDDGWTQMAAGHSDNSHRTVASGETHNWSLSLLPHPTPHTDSTTFLTADLAEGTYRFTVTGTLANNTQLRPRAKFTLTKRTTTKTSTEP